MLFGGGRVPKHHVRIEAYGTVDELNSYLGVIRAQKPSKFADDILKEIQERLFTLGAILATNPEKVNAQPPDLHPSDVEYLEVAIDKMEQDLPELRNFILPGGNVEASHAHVARCICRRAERISTQLAELEAVPELVIHYLNRLSDMLFVLARWLVLQKGDEELTWTARMLGIERSKLRKLLLKKQLGIKGTQRGYELLLEKRHSLCIGHWN